MQLAHDDRGSGPPVLFIAGRGGLGRTWHLHQVPAFQRAGYRVVTFDNRGVGATAAAEGFTTADMVADTAELIERLGLGPVRVVGASMGAWIAQELMLARPELVTHAVLMAARGRHDRARRFFGEAEHEMLALGRPLPARYDAKIRLLESFSPATLNDDAAVRDWIDMFTAWPIAVTPGLRTQLLVGPTDNRLPAYRAIRAKVLVIGFRDDVVLPPHLGREVADVIPGAQYAEIADAGHLGFVERPAEVNAAALTFLAG